MNKKDITLFGYTITDIIDGKHLEEFEPYIDASLQDEPEFPYIKNFYPLSVNNSIFEIYRPDKSMDLQCNLSTKYSNNPLVVFPLDDWKDVIITDIKIKVDAFGDKKLRVINYKGLLLLTDMRSVYGDLITLRFYAHSINNTNLTLVNGIMVNKDRIDTFEWRIYPLSYTKFVTNNCKELYDIIECKNLKKEVISLYLMIILPNQKLIQLKNTKWIKSIKAECKSYGEVNYSDYILVTINDDIKIYITSLTYIFMFQEDFEKLAKLFN